MLRPAVRTLSFAVLALAILAVIPASQAATNVPAPTIVEPPDGFFQEGNLLGVVVSYARSSAASNPRRENMSIRLLVDGSLFEERPLASDVGISTFSVPIKSDDPIALIQVCIRKAGPGSGDEACRRIRAAGAKEFDRMRRTLEEMAEISEAVMSFAMLRLGYGHVPQSLEELVPDFLDAVPSASPFSTLYEYTATESHFALRVALPGSGELRNEDGAFTKLPRGAITDREATRLTRQQLLELAQSFESYRVDTNFYPERIEDLALLYYQPFLHPVDPYGNRYLYARGSDDYALTSLGRDGLPGGQGFDADSTVTRGMQLVATPPYRGRYESFRRTFMDMSQIAGALSYFQERNSRWPDSLSELVGGPWFEWPRPFTDFCGNPYDYHVYDTGFGNREYRLRASNCNGVPNTDQFESLLYYSADTAGNVSFPAWRFAYRWPGLFD